MCRFGVRIVVMASNADADGERSDRSCSTGKGRLESELLAAVSSPSSDLCLLRPPPSPSRFVRVGITTGWEGALGDGENPAATLAGRGSDPAISLCGLCSCFVGAAGVE